MTAKEKAEDLVYSLWKVPQSNNEIISVLTAKQLALVLVTELIKTLDTEGFDYWNEVKIEIINN
jgi:hypothetical protein